MSTPWLSLGRILFLALLLAAVPTLAQEPPLAEEIPLDRCDALPVVAVRIDGADMRFLVDTGATSMLNLKSFAAGRSRRIRVTSWSGTAATSAREVTLPELALGRHRLRDLRLPAIDLSPIGKACGGRIDGILGVDLLERMGATIDLQRRVARFGGGTPDPNEDARVEVAKSRLQECVGAFNRGDTGFLGGCFDSEIVLFTSWGEFRGRQQMMDYLRRRFFSQKSPVRFDLHPRDFRFVGDATWYGYDYSIQFAEGRVEGHGMAVCRKGLMLNMHNVEGPLVPAKQP
ncbi:MAG: aspartyl protease family protein [Acidobacteria bacterium]|nr:aspartyl protease family protein [Acidobacteriota bacterium]